ncbi:uncharacterized protein LOC117182916 isoform X1 [Belonocnema kinseyi]|uniref:uncharacterized protein LOC117182916 isoform X1 n=1 Tax=Belonocnema kinseyi TaxID=2817044 RepID=UPI00143DF9CC|nr:uncharacterized protein LOC117182916 isoform X1 [Belonocnema kinseyi]
MFVGRTSNRTFDALPKEMKDVPKYNPDMNKFEENDIEKHYAEQKAVEKNEIRKRNAKKNNSGGMQAQGCHWISTLEELCSFPHFLHVHALQAPVLIIKPMMRT